MPNPFRGRATSENVALIGSLIVCLLFVASGLGWGMNTMERLWRLRLAPSTVALVLVPIPATAWIVALWSRAMPSVPARLLRIVATLVLLFVVVLCTALTVFALFMRPTERAV